MNPVEGLLYGFSVALTPTNLLACLSGVTIGTVVGVLPGIGPVGAMALLMSTTFALDQSTALIMLAGIFYGSMYGGSTTSILLNVPGEAASVVTAIDGYQMARKGRAGAALAVAAAGSFVAGTLGTLVLMLFAPPLAEVAVKLGPPEYLVVMVAGLVFLSRIGERSLVRSLLMVALGLAVATVGMEPIFGVTRFTFGLHELGQGVDLVPVAMGVYGIAEVLTIAERSGGPTATIKVKLRDLLPDRQECRRAVPSILRGSGIGLVVGLIPGPAAILSSFASYTVEKRFSRHRQELGQGAIEGVAGPESANNAASSAALIPLLALGLPFAPTTAMLLGGLMIHGVQPGPLLITARPDIFWGVVASMYVGNLMLLVLNLPMVGVFGSLLRLPQPLLATAVILFCLVGAFALNNSLVDVWILIGSGVAGYVLRKAGFNMAPLILGLVLGPMIERRLSESLMMTRGDVGAIVSRPIAAALIVACAVVLVAPAIRAMVQRQRARSARAVGARV